jgi:hypothetical protein
MSILFLLMLLAISPALATDLPPELRDAGLFCEGCYAAAVEMRHILTSTAAASQKLKQRVSVALDSVCSTELLRRYVFSPPKMSKVITQS